LELVDDGVPQGCAELLAAALTACPPEWLATGAERLLAQARAAGKAEAHS
jgi:hypothetical protein